MTQPTVIAMGVHVLDVLVRPVSGIPEGQGAELVEQIRLTAAGTAAGTALSLAKLGCRTLSAGAVGDDAAGQLLTTLLQPPASTPPTCCGALTPRPPRACCRSGRTAPGRPGT